MANSMATLSRRLYRSLLSNPNLSKSSLPFSSNIFSHNSDSNSSSSDSDSNLNSVPDTETPQQASSSSSSNSEWSTNKRMVYDAPSMLAFISCILSITAIIAGQVGQNPIEKKLKGGRTVTLLSVGTGGIRNNRRPLDHEEPRDYVNRSSVQWHRVSIYPEQLGKMAMKNVVPGDALSRLNCFQVPIKCRACTLGSRKESVEGNLESKVFSDPITGLVQRVREIAIRRNGRIVFLGKGGDGQQAPSTKLKGVGYY